MKGNKESDHHTITTTVRTSWENKVSKRKVWNMKNKEGWQKYNVVMKQVTHEHPQAKYDEVERIMKKTMVKTIGTVTITEGKPRNIDSKEIKNIRKEKRKARKRYKKAIKNGKEKEIKEKQDTYMKISIKLKVVIEKTTNSTAQEN